MGFFVINNLRRFRVFELILIIVPLLLIGHLIVRRKYGIMTTLFVYRHQTPLQKRIELIGFIVFCVSIIFIGLFLNYLAVYIFFFAYSSAFELFRTYMEYKYEKESKHYIINGYWSIGYFILLLVCLFFNEC